MVTESTTCLEISQRKT